MILWQGLGLKTGGGRGERVPFLPDDSCDEAVFEGASADLRSPQLPYLKYDAWGCERRPREVAAVVLENGRMRLSVTPQFGGKVWSMFDKGRYSYDLRILGFKNNLNTVTNPSNHPYYRVILVV